MHKTFGSLFSGGGGADIGAKAAGLELAWGVEYVPEIAEVANANLGQHIKVANILDCNPFDFDRVDVLHASPPCPSFSVAKAGGIETELDIALARRVAEFATVLQPQVFTLENVHAYQKSKSWRIIEGALYEAGYWLSVNVINFANLGVAQTRKRMVVRAVRGGFVPYLPQPVRWVGWYEAIEDIIDTLPDSRFADWQLARLPEELKTMLVSNAKTEYSDGTRNSNDPAFTGNGESNGRVKAFLVGKNADKYGDGLRWFAPPAQTIGANEHGSKAFVIDGKNSGGFGNGPTVLNGENPIFTVQASQAKGMPRAYDGAGRVVAITPGALARFQSFPDNYMLPESKTLAAKIIGNAVPPLGYQKIIGGLL